MRSEFPAKIKVAAFKRSGGLCENVIAGVRCPVELRPGGIEYHHIIADQLGGKPTLENCLTCCRACHKVITATETAPTVARAKRLERSHINAKPVPARKLQGRGFDKRTKLRMEKPPMLPRRELYRKATQ